MHKVVYNAFLLTIKVFNKNVRLLPVTKDVSDNLFHGGILVHSVEDSSQCH